VNLTKKLLGLWILLACLQACTSSKPASEEAKNLFNNVIPKPQFATLDGKAFAVTEKTTIQYDGNDDVARLANMFAGTLKPATGFDLPVAAGQMTDGSIFLTTAGADAGLGDEGYELIVEETSIKLAANKPAGLYMGLQTLRQLISEKIEFSTKQEGPWEIATGTIRDSPVYPWRGSMLDVARHFFTVDEVKRYIDYISLYKMNTLHLHLSDDQGWRIEIKSWPKLTELGGQTEVGGAVGGFYTQEQYKDLVAYAQARYITIIPEIDMPGHTNAALASYGELNGGIRVPKEGRIEINGGQLVGKDKPTELYTGTEVGFSTMSLTKEATMRFVNDVIRELAAITPGPYIHVGGDEAHVTKKQDYIEFINRFQQIVKSHNKIMVGWEEIAQGDIDTMAIAQYWTSDKYPKLAAEKGANVIMSPSKKVYLDMQYDSLSKLGLHWAAYIEVDDAYNWDPSTEVADLDKTKILGVEAPLWSETIANLDDIEYLLFPRLPGIAEVAWTSLENRNWNDYRVRLGNQAKRFKAMGIDYYPSKKVQWIE
jgi:hexosaminidase